MRARLAPLTRSKGARDLAYTVAGRAVQVVLALLGNVVAARALGPAEFGRFGVIIAVVTIFGTLADAGLTYSAVRFIARYLSRAPHTAYSFARVYFLLRVLSGVLVAAVGFTLAVPVAAVLGQRDLASLLQISFAILLGLSVSGYPGTILTALERFGRLGVAGALNSVITVSGIVALFLLGRLTLGSLLAWNVALPLVSTLPAWFLLPREWLPWSRSHASGVASARPADLPTARELLGFSKWMFVSAAGSIVATQADLLLLSRIAGPGTVGVYSVALTLALRLDVLNQSLLTVLVPRASRLSGRGELAGYSRRVLRGSSMLAGAVLALALLAQPVVLLLYGDRYAASSGLFAALVPVVLFDLITSPLFLAALPLKRPRLLAAADWLRVLVAVAAGLALIPAFGGYGAAASRLVSRVAGALYTLRGLRRATPHVGESEQDAGAYSEAGAPDAASAR